MLVAKSRDLPVLITLPLSLLLVGAAPHEQLSPQPGACWWPQLEQVLAASTGAAQPPGDFTRAVGFLEANTGIDSGFEMTFAGYLASHRQYNHAFKAWSRWFVSNYAYLYWSDSQHLFRVDAKAKAAGKPTSQPRAPADGDCFQPTPNCEQVFGGNSPWCEFLKSRGQ